LDKVSIIIVNYNGAHHLEENLTSLKQLDYPESQIELIVFDNGSKDNSLEIVNKSYPNAKIIKSSCNTGFARPHEAASREATGDILAFLNNDMRVDPGWVRNGISMLNRSENIVCASSKIMDWRGENIDFCGGTLQYLGFADQLHVEKIDNGEKILFPCGGAMFVYRDIFIEAGCFDGDYFAIFEDVDLGWRLWVMGYQVVMATNSVVYHKGHGTLDTKKESKKRYLMHRNAMMTLIKNYSDENLNRILPLALIFAVKRALLFMGVNKNSFYFWNEESEDDGNHKCLADALNKGIPANGSDGVGKACGEDSKKAIRGMPDNYEEACIHLAALDDLFSHFKVLTEKRAYVQSMRKRQDDEIFKLFKDPFRNIMGYREYLWDEVSLFGKFALDELFNCPEAYGRRIEDGHFHAREMLEELMVQCRNGNNISNTTSHHNGSYHQDVPENASQDSFVKSENFFLKTIKSIHNNGLLMTIKKIVHRLISILKDHNAIKGLF